MIRLVIVVLVLALFSSVAFANGWEPVGPIVGEQKSLLLSYNAGTIRALLDRRCPEVRVACVAAVPNDHPKRREFAEQWYRQCLTALKEASKVGDKASWQIHDRKNAGEDWLVEPGETIGAEILCEVKPALVPIPITPPVGPPAPEELKEKMADQTPVIALPPEPKAEPPPPTKSTAPTLYGVISQPPSRSRDTVEFVVAGLGETWYALARGELDGLGVGAAGFELKITDVLLLGVRAEAGSSQRDGSPYLWVGGLTSVSVPIGNVVELGGFVRWHHSFLGPEPEPSRDRLGAGARVVIPRLIADNLGLEILLGAARALSPAYSVANGRYTEENDLTFGLGAGVVWLPFL